jgi:hypothetical protein
MSRSRNSSARETILEIGRRLRAKGSVVRVSDPRTRAERVQLAAAALLRIPIVIMPHRCATSDEWFARYAPHRDIAG